MHNRKDETQKKHTRLEHDGDIADNESQKPRSTQDKVPLYKQAEDQVRNSLNTQNEADDVGNRTFGHPPTQHDRRT